MPEGTCKSYDDDAGRGYITASGVDFLVLGNDIGRRDKRLNVGEKVRFQAMPGKNPRAVDVYPLEG